MKLSMLERKDFEKKMRTQSRCQLFSQGQFDEGESIRIALKLDLGSPAYSKFLALLCTIGFM